MRSGCFLVLFYVFLRILHTKLFLITISHIVLKNNIYANMFAYQVHRFGIPYVTMFRYLTKMEGVYGFPGVLLILF